MRLSRILFPIVAVSAYAMQVSAKAMTARQLVKECNTVTGRLQDTYTLLGKSLESVNQHGLNTLKGINAVQKGNKAMEEAINQYEGFFQNIADSKASLKAEILTDPSGSQIDKLDDCITEKLEPAFDKVGKRFDQLGDKRVQARQSKNSPQKSSTTKRFPPESSPPASSGINKTQDHPFRTRHKEL
jgi:hypothetical protein